MNFQPLINYIETVLRAEKQVPGCALKIMRNHETLFRYVSGNKDYEAQIPADGSELFYLYSCTKPVTCAAALQLVEQGKLDLDTPVSRYLPEYADAFRLENDKKIPVTQPITIRNLFTMTAGLDGRMRSDPTLELIQKNPHATTREIVSTFIRNRLLFEPGYRFEYGVCLDVLAAVIEVVSGMTVGQYMEENIFRPLGMHDTGFTVPPEKQSRIAAQYSCPEPGKIIPIPTTNGFQLTDRYESGGAGLYSCLEDYSRFADAMACGGLGLTGNRILKPETVAQMCSDHLTGFVKEDAFGTCAGHGYSYGLGVRTLISKEHGQRSSLGEFGWDGMAGTYIMMDTKYDLSIVFTMHVSGWPSCIGDGRKGLGHAPIRDLTYDILGL